MTIQERLARPEGEEQFFINDIKLLINPSDIVSLDDDYVVEETFLRSHGVFAHKSRHANSKIKITLPFEVPPLSTAASKDEPNHQYIRLITQVSHYPFCFIKSNRVRTYVSPSSLSETEYMIFAVDEVRVTQDVTLGNMLILELVLIFFNHIPLIKDFQFTDKIVFNKFKKELADKDLILGTTLASAEGAYKEGSLKDDRRYVNKIVSDLSQSTSFNEYTKHILNKILTNIELINKRTKATSITNFGVGLGIPYISEVNADILVGRELTQVLGSDFKMVTVTKITPNNNAFTDLVTGGDNAQQFDMASRGNVPSRQDVPPPVPSLEQQREERRRNNPNLPPPSDGKAIGLGGAKAMYIGKDANGNAVTITRPDPYAEAENKRREEEAKRKAEDDRKAYVDNWGNSSEDEIQKIIAANAKELFINYSELPLQKEVGVSVQSITVTRKNRLALHPIGGFKHPVIQYMGNYATDVTMKLAFDTQNKYGSELGPSLLMKQANSQLEYNRVYWPEATAHNYLKIYSLATALMGTEMFLPAQSQIIASASNNGLEIGVFNFIETNIEEFLKETSVRGSGIKNTANYNKYMNDILIDLTNYFRKNFPGIATLKNDPVFNIYASMIDVIAKEYYETRIYELFHGENLKINSNKSSLKIRDLLDDKELKRYLDFLSRSILKIRQLALNNKEGDRDKELTHITDKVASTYGENNPTIKAYIQKILTEGFSGSIGLNSYLDQLMLHLNEDAKYSSITVKYLENYLTLFSFNVKRFNSAAIPDLYLENLTLNITEKIENDVASINEIALQSMTPFFFIKETPHLTDTNIEDQILQLQNLDTLQENIVAMSKANIEGDKLEWGGDNPNIDAAIPLRYGNVVDERIYETAKLTEDELKALYEANLKAEEEERKRKGAQATEATEPVKAEQTVSINTQDLTVQGMNQSQINWMVVVYKAFIELNLDSTLAAALTAEVGREGDYKEINMFGTHKDDGNSKSNLGIISFQGTRRENLMSFMKARGFELVDNQFPKTEECVKAQAAFTISELEGTYKDIYGVILQEIEKGATADDLSDKVYAPYSVSTYGPMTGLKSGDKGNIKYGKPLLVSYIGWVWGDNDRYNGVWQAANSKRRGYLKNLENILLTHATASPKVNPKANNEIVTLKEHAILDNTLKSFFVNVLYDGDTAKEAVVLPANKPIISLRFADINAPEIKKSDADPTPEHYALESRDRTKAWLSEYNNIIYIPAALLGKETETGSFANRGLAFKIYVRKGPNIYYEVAEKSLKEGWAKALTGNLAKENKYKEWENEAKTALRGLWKPSTTVAADANNPNPIVVLAIPKNLFDRTVNHGTKRGDKLAEDILPIKVRPGDNWAITSGFGLRTRASTSGGGVSSSNHSGIDLANFGANGTEGAALIALGTGVVINKGNHGATKGYGHFITIRYTPQISALYGHMKQASNLKIGDSVQKGQVVGLVGNTGNSSGAHLHFEMLHDNKAFNFHALKTGQLSGHFADPAAALNWDKLSIDVASSLPTYLTQPIKTGVKKTPKEYSLFNEKILYEFFKQNMKKTINRGLLTSVPSIKVYVTIGNEDQDLFFTNGVKIQYYEINGIRAVKLKTNDDKNPIDVMSLVIADAAFVNTDHMAGLRKLEMVDIEKIGTDLETQFKNDRIKLRPGMKLHVRMGYCADDKTEILTENGWVRYNQLKEKDKVYTLNHESGIAEWNEVEKVNIFNVVEEDMVSIEGQIHSSLTTLGHKWPVLKHDHKNQRSRTWTTSKDLLTNHHLILGAESLSIPKIKKYSDSFVELIAWFWTEGSIVNNNSLTRNPSARISQSSKVNLENILRIRKASEDYFNSKSQDLGTGNRYQKSAKKRWREGKRATRDEVVFFYNTEATKDLLSVAQNRVVSLDFIKSLTKHQLELFIKVSNLADGYNGKNHTSGFILSQKNPEMLKAIELACILLGYRVKTYTDNKIIKDRQGNDYQMTNLSVGYRATVGFTDIRPTYTKYTGVTWCPTTKNHTWLAKRDGKVFFTGNSNDPNDLDIVFNGSVISTRNLSATSIEVICESFGKELLGEIIGHNKPKSLGGGWNASTGTLFADVLLSNSIYHFGKTWSLARSILFTQNAGDSSDPEAKTLLQSSREDPKERVGETNIFNMNYYFGVKFLSAKALRHRVYTNIYTAEVEYHDDEFDSPLVSMGANLFQIGKPTRYSFYAFHDTPWSVMKQAEYRHPGTIAKPLWYEDRCTMFYGIKEQCYIAREGNTTLQQMAVAETISGKVGNVNYGDGGVSAPGAVAMVGATGAALVATALAPATLVVLGTGFLASLLLITLYGEDKIKAANTNFLDQYYLRRVERMAPAVEFHIITCKSNLISNGIKLNSDYKTKLNVSYFIDDRDVSDGYDRNFDSFAMQSDDNLNAFDIREGEINLAGCDGKYMSYRYGTTGLMKEAETMYGGSIFILGQPNMKAGDYAYLDDSTLRLQGIIKIRECYHHFDEKRGFITEIVPGQYVEPAQFMRSPLFLKFGLAGQNIANLLKEQSHFTSRDFSDYSDTIAIMHQVITLGELQGLDYFNSLIIENPYTTITTSTTAAFFYLTLRRVLGKLSTRPLGFISNMFKFGATSTRFGWYLGTNAARIAVGTLTASYRGLAGLRAAAKANPGFVSKTSAIYATMQAKGSALIQTARELPAKIGVATAAARAGTVTTRLGEGIRIILRFVKVSPLGLLLDVFFTLALAYVFAKVEEDKFARQPLVFYPLIRHGKTYTAGMSGVIRNGKFASLKMELGKTWKAVKRATTIVNANRENSNLAPVFNFANNPSAYRKITPSFALSKEELIKDPIYIELSGQRPSR